MEIEIDGMDAVQTFESCDNCGREKQTDSECDYCGFTYQEIITHWGICPECGRRVYSDLCVCGYDPQI